MMEKHARILLVEDEQPVAKALKEILLRNGYSVECSLDGKNGLRRALSGDFNLILLDVMLPGMNGFEFLKQLRKRDKETPVILLSAMGGIQDKVTGLDHGANDYLPKPFNTDELLARVRVSLRQYAEEVPLDRITIANTTLVTQSRKLLTSAHEVTLSRQETKLVSYFFRNETVILPYDSILSQVWENQQTKPETLTQYVGFLNRKFAAIEAALQIIDIRGIGYKLLEK